MDFSNVKLPSNRKFGLTFAIAFAVAGTYFLYGNAIIASLALLGAATLLLVITALKPEALFPLNKLWMRFGFLLGTIVSPIVIGAIFFGLFTPIAIFMRMVGRDELRLKLEPWTSYWVEREPNQPRPDTFKDQF